jgi:hypothetical protein
LNNEIKKKGAPSFDTIDGATLMSTPLQLLRFVVESLISQGLHVLAGSPKVGKSWLALWLAVMVAKGEPVWNMPTRQGTTLYLCLEDSRLRIQNRLFEIIEDAPPSVHFCTDAYIIRWSGGTHRELHLRASRHDAHHHRHAADGERNRI